MNILVLGGTGAMGIPLIRILASQKHELVVTTRSEKKSNSLRIKYVTGDAHDKDFIDSLFIKHYDAIIDFMIYDTETFRQRVKMFLNNTDQYFFFSSSRVYADAGDDFIVEQSLRLLDTTYDSEYLKTDEYALAKAREEDILRNSGSKNWTIIRPYITYNDERLQLGTLEKEQWLYRALKGKAIVFGRDVASKYTTLTYGYDVALRIADLVGNEKVFGETVHITASEYILWADILEIYLNAFEKEIGYRPKVCWINNSEILFNEINYQLIYDRLYDRRFDNHKINSLSKCGTHYIKIEDGLSKCLKAFLSGNRNFRNIGWRNEAKLDRVTGERSKLSEIHGVKNKIKYILFRYIINELK